MLAQQLPFLCQSVTKAANAPNTTNNKIIPIKEITNPAMANPLGGLNIPQAEKISPSNQIIQPKKGTQPKNKAIKASTKPAVPNPLERGTGY